MDEGDGGSFGGSDGPALAKKVDLVVSIDASLQVEGQMEIQQGGGRTGTRDRALFGQGLLPGGVGGQTGGAANGGILALHLAVEYDLGGRIAADFFIGQHGPQALLQGAEAALDLAFGLGAGSDQMSNAQSGEGALELRTGIAIIGHGIMAKEAQSVSVDDHRQVVLEEEAAEMLEMIPGRVGGDEDPAHEFAGMIVDGQQQGLLLLGGPPLVDGGIVLPQLVDAGALPAPTGFDARFGLANEVREMGSGKGRHRFAMTLEAEPAFQFIGHQLEVGWFLEGEELPEEGDGLCRPVGPMVAAGGLGGEA